jgi:hypothetical protein
MNDADSPRGAIGSVQSLQQRRQFIEAKPGHDKQTSRM